MPILDLVLWVALVALPLSDDTGGLPPGALPAPLPAEVGPPVGDATEEGTAITVLPFTITEPGRYYLRRNLTGVAGSNGIDVTVDSVTIDLNGFALIGVPGAARGISVGNGIGALKVCDGTIRGWDNYGVFASDRGGNLFSDLTVADNGLTGLVIGPHSAAVRCHARTNAFSGISATIGSSVTECTATGSAIAGFSGTASTFEACTARSNSGSGFMLTGGNVVRSCVAYQNTANGIRCDAGDAIVGNVCISNGASGISTISAGSVIRDNHVQANLRGIEVAFAGNLVVGNSARSNTTEYDIVAGNTVGPVVDETTVATDDNPHANYEL